MKTNNNKRCGFVLYVVLAILLAMSMVAFSLSSFKSGAVNMLAKNADQNRLVLAAQAANAETIAYIRRTANETDSPFWKYFRDIFKEAETNSNVKSVAGGDKNFSSNQYPVSIAIDSKIIANAREIASKDNSTVETTVILNYYHEALWNSVWGYNGYIDVISTAKGADARGNNVIRIKERRDIRAMDLTHYLDRYALFVKCYSPDLNHPTSRVVVCGLPEDYKQKNGFLNSRIYLGNHLYSDMCGNKGVQGNVGEQQNVWLDLYFDEHKDLDGFKRIFGPKNKERFLPSAHQNPSDDIIAKRTKIVNHIEGQENDKNGSFQQLVHRNLQYSDFYRVTEIRTEYEKTVSRMAAALYGETDEKKVKYCANNELRNYCQTAINKADSESSIIGALMNTSEENNANYWMCKDYIDGTKSQSGNYFNYGSCEGFRKFVKTFIASWSYEYAYVDAASIWDIERDGDGVKNKNPNGDTRYNFLLPNSWTLASYAAGLTDDRNDKDSYKAYEGPYQYAFKDYNYARSQLGRMASLYGPESDISYGGECVYHFPTKVIVEGPVFLRFFKLAYLASFTTSIPFGTTTKVYLGNGKYRETVAVNAPVQSRYIPLKTRRLDEPQETFLNIKLKNDDLSLNNKIFNDKYLMSYAIDTIPINELIWGEKLKEDLTGNESDTVESVGQYKCYLNNYILGNKLAGAADPLAAVRRIDPTCCSFAYDTGKEFVAERLEIRDGKPILHIDGVIFIEGNVDEVMALYTNEDDTMYFEGSGMIYLKNGNCLLKNLRKNAGHEYDTLRIVLQNGNFNIKKTKDSKNKIDASLCAFVTPREELKSNKKGKLNFDGQDEVYIYGNVLVDYLYTYRPYTESTSTCLSKNGRLVIMHDPVLVSPETFKDEQYCAGNQWVSIGTARTTYSMSAQGDK